MNVNIFSSVRTIPVKGKKNEFIEEKKPFLIILFLPSLINLVYSTTTNIYNCTTQVDVSFLFFFRNILFIYYFFPLPNLFYACNETKWNG